MMVHGRDRCQVLVVPVSLSLGLLQHTIRYAQWLMSFWQFPVGLPGKVSGYAENSSTINSLANE